MTYPQALPLTLTEKEEEQIQAKIQRIKPAITELMKVHSTLSYALAMSNLISIKPFFPPPQTLKKMDAFVSTNNVIKNLPTGINASSTGWNNKKFFLFLHPPQVGQAYDSLCRWLYWAYHPRFQAWKWDKMIWKGLYSSQRFSVSISFLRITDRSIMPDQPFNTNDFLPLEGASMEETRIFIAFSKPLVSEFLAPILFLHFITLVQFGIQATPLIQFILPIIFLQIVQWWASNHQK